MESQILTELQDQSILLESTLSKLDSIYSVISLGVCFIYIAFLTFIIIKWRNKND